MLCWCSIRTGLNQSSDSEQCCQVCKHVAKVERSTAASAVRHLAYNLIFAVRAAPNGALCPARGHAQSGNAERLGWRRRVSTDFIF